MTKKSYAILVAGLVMVGAILMFSRHTNKPEEVKQTVNTEDAASLQSEPIASARGGGTQVQLALNKQEAPPAQTKTESELEALGFDSTSFSPIKVVQFSK